MDIAFFKTEHLATKEFFQKYCQFRIPSQTTLRSIGNKIYDDQMEAVRIAIGEDPICIELDGTSDKTVSLYHTNKYNLLLL